MRVYQVVLRMRKFWLVLALILAVCEYGCSTYYSKLLPSLKVGSQYAFSAFLLWDETLPPSWPLTAVVPIL